VLELLDLRQRRERLEPRRLEIDPHVADIVAGIVGRVREEGDDALFELTERFDGADLRGRGLLVPHAELESAGAGLPPELRRAIDALIERVAELHRRQLPPAWRDARGGVRFGEVVRPLRAVGCYVPGGRAVYPSSVAMTVTPARVAGVEEIVVATPPRADGSIHPEVLYAARRAGATAVARVGGAQAIAALAFGTASIPAVDKVVGPGNAYVTEAKRQLNGAVGIDGLAGPTELVLVADAAADPAWIAIDLVAQAEHDPDALATLVTDDPAVAARVDAALEDEVARADRRDIVEVALKRARAVIVADLGQALEVVDELAPEHLQLAIADAASFAAEVRNAGAIFVGERTPVPFGDYGVASNHVLPTGGTARFASGLRAADFVTVSSVVELDAAAAGALAVEVATIALSEGLGGHARAVEVRATATDDGPRARSRGALPRPGLRDRDPYEAPQLDVPARLNTNECPYPLSDAFRVDLADAVRDLGLNRYPEREADRLRDRLAALNGHAVEGVWAANGSNEILQQILQAYAGPGRRVIVFEPTYALHARIAWVVHADVERVELDEPWAITADDVERAAALRPDVVFVCSPNNPTGNAQPVDAVAALADAVDALVVVDEAYVEFGGESAAHLVAGRPNVVVVRTFSKAFALAGARVGYCLATPEVVEDLRRVRLPYHLSAITQAAGLVALDHREEALGILDAIRTERDRILEALPPMGAEAFPSDANFVLFRPPKPAAEVWQGLLDRGVLVRDFSALVPGCLRVTAGTPEEVDRFQSALEEVVT
jgi:histidinol dehydrogenase